MYRYSDTGALLQPSSVKYEKLHELVDTLQNINVLKSSHICPHILYEWWHWTVNQSSGGLGKLRAFLQAGMTLYDQADKSHHHPSIWQCDTQIYRVWTHGDILRPQVTVNTPRKHWSHLQYALSSMKGIMLMMERKRDHWLMLRSNGDDFFAFLDSQFIWSVDLAKTTDIIGILHGQKGCFIGSAVVSLWLNWLMTLVEVGLKMSWGKISMLPFEEKNSHCTLSKAQENKNANLTWHCQKVAVTEGTYRNLPCPPPCFFLSIF